MILAKFSIQIEKNYQKNTNFKKILINYNELNIFYICNYLINKFNFNGSDKTCLPNCNNASQFVSCL